MRLSFSFLPYLFAPLSPTSRTNSPTRAYSWSEIHASRARSAIVAEFPPLFGFGGDVKWPEESSFAFSLPVSPSLSHERKEQGRESGLDASRKSREQGAAHAERSRERERQRETLQRARKEKKKNEEKLERRASDFLKFDSPFFSSLSCRASLAWSLPPRTQQQLRLLQRLLPLETRARVRRESS